MPHAPQRTRQGDPAWHGFGRADRPTHSRRLTNEPIGAQVEQPTAGSHNGLGRGAQGLPAQLRTHWLGLIWFKHAIKCGAEAERGCKLRSRSRCCGQALQRLKWASFDRAAGMLRQNPTAGQPSLPHVLLFWRGGRSTAAPPCGQAQRRAARTVAAQTAADGLSTVQSRWVGGEVGMPSLGPCKLGANRTVLPRRLACHPHHRLAAPTRVAGSHWRTCSAACCPPTAAACPRSHGRDRVCRSRQVRSMCRDLAGPLARCAPPPGA